MDAKTRVKRLLAKSHTIVESHNLKVSSHKLLINYKEKGILS